MAKIPQKKNKYEIIELYAKENNLLQLPLFYFEKNRLEKTVMEWVEENGTYCKLGCICKYGVPNGFDLDVYTSAMRIWVQQGMPNDGIRLNYSDIAKELKLSPKRWVNKIKNSLKKLAQARYEMIKCFIIADKQGRRLRVDTSFSLFDSVSLFGYTKGESKKKSWSHLIFPNIIQKNLEARYYQFLDIVTYLSLPTGLSRRLYEYLEKRRYHNLKGVFTIAEELLCRWLPVTDKNPTQRRESVTKAAEELRKIGYLSAFVFDKKKKQWNFTYANEPVVKKEDIEIISSKSPNEVTTNIALNSPIAQPLLPTSTTQTETTQTASDTNKPVAESSLEVIPKLTPGVNYFNEDEEDEPESIGQIISQMGQNTERKEKRRRRISRRCKEQKIVPEEEIPRECEAPNTPKETGNIQELFALMRIKEPSKQLEAAINRHYKEKGFEYVKGHILYANANAKKDYSVYLQQALAKNWAVEWIEKQREKEAKKAWLNDEERKKEERGRFEESLQQDRERLILEQKKKQEVKAHQELFMERLKHLDIEIKKGLWEKADSIISQEHPNLVREFCIIKVQKKYGQLLLEYFNAQGAGFVNDVIMGKFIEEVAKDYRGLSKSEG